ncbi:MAG: caspase family protein [Bifidobacteriaceae bacterium]|jgi:hypothetical protein|nr:caspase family protein [Bifidobacteriaceae bacterium]
MRAALFTGIDAYRADQHYAPLPGATSDAQAICQALANWTDGSLDGAGNPRINWAGHRTQVLVNQSDIDEYVTQSKLNQALDALLATSGDHILFYFAGHGDIIDGRGLLLATHDDQPDPTLNTGPDGRRGVYLRDLIDRIRQAGINSATIMLDCCHAGFLEGIDPPNNTAIIAATRGVEQAKERNGHGLFTTMLLEGLKGGAADVQGRITAVSLYTFAAGAISSYRDRQQPVLKASLERLIPLQRREAKVSLKGLVQPTNRFRPGHDGILYARVTKDHEATQEQTDTALATLLREGNFRTRPKVLREPSPEQLEFDYFAALRNAGLLRVPPEYASLYWACMAEGRIELTPLGEYYWQLAQDNKLSDSDD